MTQVTPSEKMPLLATAPHYSITLQRLFHSHLSLPLLTHFSVNYVLTDPPQTSFHLLPRRKQVYFRSKACN